jgi:hypothetical protein
MRKQLYFLSVLFYLIVQMSASSQDGYILVVGSSESDSSVVEILELAGFNVARGLDYSGILASEKLDSVNDADLVIFSRNGATSGHGEAEDVMQQWADVMAPILSLSPWIMRNNRWRWINSAALSCHGSDSIMIPPTEQNHPIYTGVDVSTGFLEVIEPGKTRNEKFLIDDNGTPVDAGTGIILAQDPTDEGIIAAEWSEGDYFYDGGEILAPIAGSDRLWLGFVTEGDNCQQEGNIMSAFNGNGDAETIFLNAVNYMMGLLPSTIQTEKNNMLHVFPNPATDLLTIPGLNAPVNYQIIDITGSVILTGSAIRSIDIASLVPGLYILRTENQLSVKFVKQ